jgi:hypothetical protein
MTGDLKLPAFPIFEGSFPVDSGVSMLSRPRERGPACDGSVRDIGGVAKASTMSASEEGVGRPHIIIEGVLGVSGVAGD